MASEPSPDDRVPSAERRLTLSTPSMDCQSCAGKVTSSVERLDGVRAVDARPATGSLVVTYDPSATHEDEIRARVEAAGYAIDDGLGVTDRFDVPAMDCPSCAEKIERALARRDGVLDWKTRPATGRVVVTYDPDRVVRAGVVGAIERAGYDVTGLGAGPEVTESRPSVVRSRRAVATALGGFVLLVGLALTFPLAGLDPVVGTVAGRVFLLSQVLFLASILLAGTPILRNGYYSARNRSLDIDFLMSAGILGAVGAHLPFEGAALAVLFSTAQLLERFSMDRARRSLRELMELSPDEATILVDGDERSVPAGEVVVGNVVVVRAGETIPTDGVVVDGAGSIDQAPITGESVPVDGAVGEEVFAGSIVESGYLEVEATTEASQSTLARIVELVEDAQSGRTKREQFVDRFARHYTPIVVAGAVLTVLVPPLVFGAPWRTWFLRGLTLLVLACPCAFVISTPVSVVSGITSAARNGVLVKGGDHLEAMGEIDIVAFDKTGTLTTGDLTVTDVVPLNGQRERDVLRCASALERRSEHPLARAIVSFAAERGVVEGDEPVIENFETLTGRGVRADLDGVTHYVGKPDLFADLGFDLSHAHATDGGWVRQAFDRPTDDPCDRGSCLDLAVDTIPRLEREGKTIVLVGTEESLEGVIAIADRVRPEASEAVARLREHGIRTVMLTGDNRGTARAIAAAVGVDAFHAELLPEGKVDLIDDLASGSSGVAMVGDGINDAPALASATVGIAMGAAGTDTALETADVALMGDDLSRLPYLVTLSRRANGVIRQNVWSSLAVKAALAIGAPFGLVTVVHAVVIGDMGMSLAVTGNAMRLTRIGPDDR